MRKAYDGVLAGVRGFSRLAAANPLVALSLIFLLGVIVSALSADVLAPYGPNQQEIAARLRPPGSPDHLFGTDVLGRDLLARLLHGTRMSLLVPAVGVFISLSLGVPLGLVAGFYGGTPDALIMRLADLQMAFSTMLLILVIVVMVGPGAGSLMLVFGVAHWVIYARMVRGAALSLRETQFVKAAECIGCRNSRIMFVHIVPNVFPTLLSLGIVEMARLMVAEAGLSFLGFGVQPPQVTWGLMIAAGREYLSAAWWLVTLPGLAIALTVLAISLVGVWLRDVTSPYAWLNKTQPPRGLGRGRR